MSLLNQRSSPQARPPSLRGIAGAVDDRPFRHRGQIVRASPRASIECAAVVKATAMAAPEPVTPGFAEPSSSLTSLKAGACGTIEPTPPSTCSTASSQHRASARRRQPSPGHHGPTELAGWLPVAGTGWKRRCASYRYRMNWPARSMKAWRSRRAPNRINHGSPLPESHLACADTPDHSPDKQIRMFRELRILCGIPPRSPIRLASSLAALSIATWCGRAPRSTASIRRRGAPTRCGR
jgi:hypothetical protein